MTDILDTDADEITQLRADLMGQRDAYGLLLIRCEQAEAALAALRAKLALWERILPATALAVIEAEAQRARREP